MTRPDRTLRWRVRRGFWNFLARKKFKDNQPATIPEPKDAVRLNPAPLRDVAPAIPIESILVADSVPMDEASLQKKIWYKVQVALYGLYPAMQKGLPSISGNPNEDLDEAYTKAHRKGCVAFAAPSK